MEILKKTFNQENTIQRLNSGRNLHFMDKSKRDAIFKLCGGKKSTSRNQQMHPEYIEDFEGEIEIGFGNSQYRTYFKVLYNLQNIEDEV